MKSADKRVVALAQISPRLGDLDANRQLFEQSIDEAIAAGAELVVFPELALTGYFLKDQVPTVAQRGFAGDLDWLRERSRDIAIVAGMVEESRDALFFNAALYFESGRLLYVHRKCYLPTYGLFDEQRYFARGHALRAFDSQLGRSSMLICEDMWHPSAVYLNVLDGAQLLICISSSPTWGVSGGELPANAAYWEQLLRFHASTWGIYVVYCNRVGFEDGVGFWGGSEITDPFGKPVCKAPYYEPAIVLGEVCHAEVRRKRLLAPLLRDEDLDLTFNELKRIRKRRLCHPNGEHAP